MTRMEGSRVHDLLPVEFIVELEHIDARTDLHGEKKQLENRARIAVHRGLDKCKTLKQLRQAQGDTDISKIKSSVLRTIVQQGFDTRALEIVHDKLRTYKDLFELGAFIKIFQEYHFYDPESKSKANDALLKSAKGATTV